MFSTGVFVGASGTAVMNDDDLLRYSRHLLLDDIGIEGQRRLLSAHALVVGAGGLGSPVALYLGSAGVGRITIVDDDDVDLTNLQRQIAHDLSRIGTSKAQSAARSIGAINPAVQVTALRERADAGRFRELVADVDVVLDCSDNFATRHALNAACVAHATAARRRGCDRLRRADLGLRSALGRRRLATRALSRDDAFADVACSTMGVLAPLVGIIGSMQAAEALKLIVGIGASLAGRLQMLDAKSMEWTEVLVQRDPGCAVCAVRASNSLAPMP